MSFTLTSHQLAVNCRRIFSYGLTDLVADEHHTLKRSALKPIFYRELHDMEAKPHLPPANTIVEDIAPAVLATLGGIWAHMTEANTYEFSMISHKLFESVPILTSHAYSDVAATVRGHELFSKNEEIRSLADKIIHASNS